MKRVKMPKDMTIGFTATREEIKLLHSLKVFSKSTTRTAVFKIMLYALAGDFASLEVDPAWSAAQKVAHQHCCEIAVKLRRALMRGAAKSVLKKRKPTDTMTTTELAEESISEIQRIKDGN